MCLCHCEPKAKQSHLHLMVCFIALLLAKTCPLGASPLLNTPAGIGQVISLHKDAKLWYNESMAISEEVCLLVVFLAITALGLFLAWWGYRTKNLCLKVVGFALVVGVFLTLILRYPQYGEAISICATLALAIAAFFSILSISEERKRRRKEHLLNETIEWAEDIIKAGWEPVNPVPSVLNDEDVIKAGTFLWNETMRSLVQFEILLSKQARFGLEIVSLILGSELSQAMEDALNKLRLHVDLLNKCLDEFGQYDTDINTLSKRQENLRAIGAQKRQLNVSAQTVLEVAAKIKSET